MFEMFTRQLQWGLWMTKDNPQDLPFFVFYCVFQSTMFVESYHQILYFQLWYLHFVSTDKIPITADKK